MKNLKDKRVDPYLLLSRYLHKQGQLIRDVSGSKEVAELFESVGEFIKSTPRQELRTLLDRRARPKVGNISFDVLDVPLDELENIVVSQEASRRMLESIAVDRFHVPKGSMRSYSSVDILREKIIQLIENARTHLAIADIASRDQK